MLDKAGKIYVAGHRGLVGSAFVRRLKAAGYENLVLKTRAELDLRRQEAVEEFFETERPSYVFLAAARVGGILANNTYKAEFIHDNLTIATNVIHASYQFGVKKLLNLGSSCIYPRDAAQPLKEEYLLTGPLEQTNEPYAIAKIAAIKLCRYYNEQYGTDFISVMPPNLYGSDDNFNLDTSHVLPALIRKFILAKALMENDETFIRNDVRRRVLGLSHGPELADASYQTIVNALQYFGISATEVSLWGSGTPLREFLYVEDLADAGLFFMREHGKEQLGEFINVGSGVDLSIEELALLVSRTVGFSGKLVFDRSKPDGTPRKLLDITRAKALGWNPLVFLPEGIRTVCTAYVH